jgi:hypothetical protein
MAGAMLEVRYTPWLWLSVGVLVAAVGLVVVEWRLRPGRAYAPG